MIYIVGHKGWIGQMYINLFKTQGIQYTHSHFRGEDEEIKIDILNKKTTHILCCMGRTHGVFNGVEYNTIDYLENKETIHENINDNLYVPLNLALFAKEKLIHFTYIGTGCIFKNTSYINEFTESDNPNFFESNYSIVKGFTDMLMRNTDALVLRIRMPITNTNNPHNFITKILKYNKICSMPNSMSVLDELLPISIKMMLNYETGCFNFTNPGYIDHNSILVLYRNYIDPLFEWTNFTVEEQSKILKSGRSNNVLNTTKLTNKYQVLSIEYALEKVFKSWKA